MAWDWSEPRRYLFETQVMLPLPIWFRGNFNGAARVFAFQLRTTATCRGTDRFRTPKKQEVLCDFEDVSLLAASPSVVKYGKGVDQLVRQHAVALQGSTARLVVDRTGWIRSLALEGLPQNQLRLRTRNEVLAQVARFALVGLEVPLAPGGVDVWVGNHDSVCTLPTARGISAPVESVHHGAVRKGSLEIASHSRGLMQTADTSNSFTCEVTARTFFEPGVGAITRTWEMVGHPTPSSRVALGTSGYTFSQRGGMRRLEPDEAVEVGPSGGIHPPTPGSALLPETLH